MNFGVIGGGFGIYGWLSALNFFPEIKIATLLKYKKIILNRHDIQNTDNLIKKIIWFDDEDLLLKKIDALIIARRPIDQVEIINKLINHSWKGSLIIEKPIAPNSYQSKIILKKMLRSKFSLQVGFSIKETKWSNRIQKLILEKNPKEININWSFYAHHYKNNYVSWKSNPYFGGGALNFYCIHFIAWLSSFSSWNVISCSSLKNKIDDPKIFFELSNKKTRLKMNLNCMYKKFKFFKITENKGKIILNIDDPFCEGNSRKGDFQVDKRVPYLIEIINKTLDCKYDSDEFLYKHLELWNTLEKLRDQS